MAIHIEQSNTGPAELDPKSSSDQVRHTAFEGLTTRRELLSWGLKGLTVATLTLLNPSSNSLSETITPQQALSFTQRMRGIMSIRTASAAEPNDNSPKPNATPQPSPIPIQSKNTELGSQKFTIYADPPPPLPNVKTLETQTGKKEMQILDTTPIPAPAIETLASYCTEAHVLGYPEVKIQNTHITGVVLCFPDQLDGIQAAKDNYYQPNFGKLLESIPPFYRQFMGINVTTDVKPNYLPMSQNFFDYKDPWVLTNEAFSKLPSIDYSNGIYQAYCLLYAPNRNIPLDQITQYLLDRGTSIAGKKGVMIIPWYLIQYPDYDFYHNTVRHEAGHTFGMVDLFPQEDPNGVNLMSPDHLYNGKDKILVIRNILGIGRSPYGVYLPNASSSFITQQ